MLHCIVNNCNVTLANISPGIYLHPCPQSLQRRKQWLSMLKDKCNIVDWQTSRICSKHFEQKYFDSNRKLKENAVPTKFYATTNYSKLDCKIQKLSQKQLQQDIKDSIEGLEEPLDLADYVKHDLEISPAAPYETQLWYIIKKQHHLIRKLSDSADMYKNYASSARKELENTKANTKELEKNLETQKYLVKSLQEKQATLEEQLEIITAVESRK